MRTTPPTLSPARKTRRLNFQGRRLRWIIAAALGLAAAPALAREDWQYWSTWSAMHPLSERSAVSAMAEVYFRDNLSEDYVYDEYLTYSFQAWRGFGLVAQLYFESVKDTEGAWTATRSAVAGPTYAVELPYVGRLKLEDRFFYRLNSPAEWDYHRPRIYLSRDFGPLTLMLSDELRLDLSCQRAYDFYRNRIYATVLWKAMDHLSLGLGYLRQSDRADNGDWSSFNGVQTVVNVTF